MNVNCLSSQLYFSFVVLIKGLGDITIIVSDSSDLDGVVEVKAGRFYIKCIKVRFILLLESLLPLLIVLFLSNFLLQIHLAEAEALLFSFEVGCLCLPLALLSFWRQV